MTATAAPALRIVSFGDPAGDVWGSAMEAGGEAIVFGTADGVGSAAGSGAIGLTDDGDGWRLAGDGFDLWVTAATDDDGAAQVGADELCRVTGTLSVAGSDRTIDCLGVRSTGAGLQLGGVESLRGVSGWFDAENAVALVALRPVGSRGQDRDLIAATVFEPEGRLPVQDPRMSTTFGPGERVHRTTLELWVGDGEEQYSRRAAAEALGDGSIVEGDRITLAVTPLRCHTRGLDGAGVYLLAHLR